MPDYEILSVESDAKTVKGTKKGVLTGIFYGSPAREADGVHDLCVFSTEECRHACLYGAGMAGVFPTIKAARVRKTLLYLNDQEAFKEALRSDIRKLEREAESRGMVPAVRVNGTTDIPKLAQEMAREFSHIQFYDYTKIPSPWKRTMANYHLTFSFSGLNFDACVDALMHGINVAVVFTGKLPELWNGYKVIDGDQSDVRFKDELGVIVGLKTKGKARTMDAGGFIQIGQVA